MGQLASELHMGFSTSLSKPPRGAQELTRIPRSKYGQRRIGIYTHVRYICPCTEFSATKNLNLTGGHIMLTFIRSIPLASLLFATMLSLTCSVFVVTPAQALSLSFIPQAPNVPLGSSVVVGVQVSGLGSWLAPSLRSELIYNKNFLDFTGVTFGDPNLGNQLNLSWVGSTTTINEFLNVLTMTEESSNSSLDLHTLQADEFTLIQMTFDATDLGEAGFIFNAGTLRDATGNLFAGTSREGEKTTVLNPVSSPEPVSIGLLGSGLVGLVFWRKKFHSVL